MSLSAQAREQGLNVRVTYDAVAALRRKGVLPPGRASRRVVAGDFVAVSVEDAPPLTSAMMCRLRIGAVPIECREWPPALWLASLSGMDSDAEPSWD